ncbi:glyoxalase superfamily protein [Dyadobacter bucti]|uniref:glyoxalase superfamily protein n=1 Tax=Dyadobacter bucti TaxID=2572203 RepID=UPI00110A04AF|nr:glyoxalase superfamily protein [Dyadobacter bucti]
MKIEKVIPILRIFDEAKTMEFYIGWLGFTIDWQHRYEDNAPLYMQISKDGLVLHLSEHHGDATPGAKIFIECSGVRELQKELNEKKYKYHRPGLVQEPWNAISVTVVDPFMNRIAFNERIES